MRNTSSLSTDLKYNAAPLGFVNFPIYTYINAYLWNNNGPDFDNCNYAVTSYHMREDNNSIYDAYKQV